MTGTPEDEPLFDIGERPPQGRRSTVQGRRTDGRQDRPRAGPLIWSERDGWDDRPASALPRARLIVSCAALVAGLAGWLLAGTLGVFIVVSAALVVTLLLLRAQLPRGARPPRRPRRPVPFPNADFPAYRRIEDTLFWAPVSARHFDHAVRPLLARLLATVLAERHRLDMTTDPAGARAAIGNDLWPLVDPARPPSDDTRAPGVPLHVVVQFLDRLEALGGQAWREQNWEA